MSELFALLVAFLFGSGIVLVRRGLVESNVLSATMIITLIGTIVFWALSLLLIPLNNVNPIGIGFFALAGLFAPGFGRLISYRGIERLGASVNASVFAVHPLFSSLLAVLLLGERPSLGIWVGMICIICGVVLIERNVRGSSVKSISPTRTELAFPLSAALLVGLSVILRKMGLYVYNEPVLAVAVTYLSSLCLYTLLWALSTNVSKYISLNRQGFQLFWKPGVIFCVAHLCLYYALRYGDVSLVAPLMNIEPFFVFILAYTFLRKMEKITSKLLAGAIIIVAGVSLITLFQ